MDLAKPKSGASITNNMSDDDSNASTKNIFYNNDADNNDNRNT